MYKNKYNIIKKAKKIYVYYFIFFQNILKIMYKFLYINLTKRYYDNIFFIYVIL